MAIQMGGIGYLPFFPDAPYLFRTRNLLEFEGLQRELNERVKAVLRYLVRVFDNPRSLAKAYRLIEV